MRYLDPKNDLTFKKVFGEHPHLLKSMLNAMLPFKSESEHIASLEYLPAEQVPQVPLLKNSIVDVRCTDQRGRQFIVEMQMLWTDSFKNRVLFNASKAYIRQLGKGMKYKSLQPVYALNFVNEIFEPDIEAFYHHYAIVHAELPGKQLEGLELVFVELPKFQPATISEKKMQVLWLRYLTLTEGVKQVPEDMLQNPEIREAVACLEESSYSEEELRGYDKYWDAVSTERSLLIDAEEKGRVEGRSEGLAEGEARGSKQEKSATVLRCRRMGMSISEISAITGLAEAEVLEILEEAGLSKAAG